MQKSEPFSPGEYNMARRSTALELDSTFNWLDGDSITCIIQANHHRGMRITWNHFYIQQNCLKFSVIV